MYYLIFKSDIMNSKKAFTHTPSFSVRKGMDILHTKGKNFLLRVINTKKLGVTLLCKGGFTLIELLVTISIITFLMSFVMASLNSARNKAIDSSMKTSLSSMRSQAAIYYDTASTYVGLCTNSSVQAALISAASSTNSNIQINKGGGSVYVTCNETATGWAIQTPLKTNSNQFFCVDSNGTAVVTEQVFGSGNDVACGAAVVAGGGPVSGLATILVVGGGGGGGAYWAGGTRVGGGGGGGEVYYNNNYSITLGQPYNVVVGQGGLASALDAGSTTFGPVIAVGGGNGARPDPGAAALSQIGASGGGGCTQTPRTAGAAGIASKGYAGGNAVDSGSKAGGGGGVGGAGTDGSGGGNGGVGVNNSITGVSVGYGGGGGGGSISGLGGPATHGGGNGQYMGSPAYNGTPNTGGGGGGGSNNNGSAGGGGSGVVIVRYLTTDFTCSGGTSIPDGLYTVRTFTSNGTLACN
jgi:prepilin-type N-terminal cleavage/methylation domain-containing protein